MNYLRHYINLIRKARKSQGIYPGIYTEKHHIIPKCLLKHKSSKIVNGKWNIVKLTSKQHFIAHMLLWKFCKQYYGKNHKFTRQMLYAWAMFFNKSGDRKLIGSRSYETLREACSKNMSGKNNHMYGKVGPNEGKTGNKNPLFGRKRPEHSKAMSGKNHPMYGKEGYWKGKVGPNKGRIASEESKLKRSVAGKEAWRKRKLKDLE